MSDTYNEAREAGIDIIAMAFAAKEAYVTKVEEAYEAMHVFQEAFRDVLTLQRDLTEAGVSREEQFEMLQEAVERSGINPELGAQAIKAARDDLEFRDLINKAPLN